VKEPVKSATKDTLDAAFDGPAYAVNRLFVTLGAGGVRVAFTEQRPFKEGEEVPTPLFRTAVMLSPQDAIALRNLLTRTLADIEAQIAEARAKADG